MTAISLTVGWINQIGYSSTKLLVKQHRVFVHWRLLQRITTWRSRESGVSDIGAMRLDRSLRVFRFVVGFITPATMMLMDRFWTLVFCWTQTSIFCPVSTIRQLVWSERTQWPNHFHTRARFTLYGWSRNLLMGWKHVKWLSLRSPITWHHCSWFILWPNRGKSGAWLSEVNLVWM